MTTVVMKFGGTSVGTIERIENVARRVQKQAQTARVVVVVSAMSGTTNKLVDLCTQANSLYDREDYDTVVSTGEQVTVGLLCIILKRLGAQAKSFMGWQMPFVTDTRHASAHIMDVSGENINEALDKGNIVVIPGFQGISDEGRITTLGRGGSDTSAVAIAAGIKADRCDIYTDVDGVYTTDPRITDKACKIDKISYEEMLELASQGAKVLQTRSVSLGMRTNTPIRVLSSFEEEEQSGTLVCDEEDIMEKNIVTGIAYQRDEARITIHNIPDKPGMAAGIFAALAKNDINVDMIVQSRSREHETTEITFTVPKIDRERSEKVLSELEYTDIVTDEAVAKISVVGIGMKSNPGVAYKMFEALGDKGINIAIISTSEIKVSVLIPAEYLELAVRHLHTVFGLDEG